jgi:hypothetical protein
VNEDSVMGFWQEDDDVALGDGPADLLKRAIRSAEPRPSFPAFLNALAAALAEFGPESASDAERLARFRLRAHFEGAPDVISRDPDDRALTEAMVEFLADTREEYAMALRRRPTVREILSTVRFCLQGGSPLIAGLPPGFTEITIEAAPA